MTDRDISQYPQEAQDYIKELRTEAQTNRLRATELDGKVQERDTLVAQANTKLDELNTKVAAGTEIANKYSALQDEHAQSLAAGETTALELNRIKAALDVGLPHTFAERLRGDTPDALKADAEAFKQSLPDLGNSTLGDRTNGTGAAPPQDEKSALTSAIARHFAELEGE
jgi:molybdopterin converting factor small subunit